ncbi:hypothetical protein NW757_001798 [Fusarium falciforme]|nr:hypothetical protein NW757_001798 [Fusarium falciforme]
MLVEPGPANAWSHPVSSPRLVTDGISNLQAHFSLNSDCRHSSNEKHVSGMTMATPEAIALSIWWLSDIGGNGGPDLDGRNTQSRSRIRELAREVELATRSE